MNLPNKLTITRIILVPILILIYMFPYATFGINVPMYHILNADISLVNIVIFIIFAVASLTDYFDGQIARKSNRWRGPRPASSCRPGCTSSAP